MRKTNFSRVIFLNLSSRTFLNSILLRWSYLFPARTARAQLFSISIFLFFFILLELHAEELWRKEMASSADWAKEKKPEGKKS